MTTDKKIFISKEKKQQLKEAENYCNQNNMSTEFMLQYMQDFANVDFETVMYYLINISLFSILFDE